MKYAHGTKVTVAKSKIDIEKTLDRYGAVQYFFGQTIDGHAVIGFAMTGRQVKLKMPLPKEGDFSTKLKFEAERRRLWRAMLLSVKARLEVVDSGICTFEEAFLSNIVMPDGMTVYEKTRDDIQFAYDTGGAPKLLGA